jgi:hypothetical protein
VKILDLLKGSLSLAEVGRCDGENESSIHSTALSPVHPERARFSSLVVSLGTDLRVSAVFNTSTFCFNILHGF